MSISALADRAITVYRRTAYVLDPRTAAASMAVTAQPIRAALVEVVVSGGTSGTGTVTISGTVDGSPGTETLTFAGPGRKATTKRFTALDPITSTGLADEASVPTISASAVGADGGRLDQSNVVVTGWPMRKDAGTASWPAPTQGSVESEITRFYMDFTTAWTPRDGDIFLDTRTGEQWQVIGHPAQHGGGIRSPMHYEIRVKRRQGSISA